jgi:hypothetical protein
MKDVIVFWASALFIALIIILLAGCADKTIYVDRIVKVDVPVHCLVPDVNSSIKGKNDAESLLNIIKERDELREAIQVCK